MISNTQLAKPRRRVMAHRWTAPRVGLAALVTMGLALCSGCGDGMSRSKSVAELAAMPGLLETEAPRPQSYQFDGQTFQVIRETSLQFLRTLPKITAERWDRGNPPSLGPWQRPDGLDDDVYQQLRRFTEPLVAQTSVDVPKAQLAHRLGFHLRSDGQSLLLIGDGRLRQLDTREGSVLVTQPLALGKAAYGVLDTLEGDHVYVCDRTSIRKIRLADGQEVAKQVDLPGPIAAWDRGRNTQRCAATTENGIAFWFDDSLAAIHRLPNLQVLPHTIAMHPEGDRVVGVAGKHLFRWQLKDDGGTLDRLPLESLDPLKTQCASGPDVDRWADQRALYSLRAAPPEGDETALQPNVRPFGLRGMGLGICTLNDRTSWGVVFGSHITAASPWPAVAMDVRFFPENTEFSQSTPLSSEAIERVQVSKAGQQVAVLDDTALRVVQRHAWMTISDWPVMPELANLLPEGRFKQLERCAAQLRSRNWPEHGMTGEEAYGQLARAIGRRWADVVATAESDERQKQLDSAQRWVDGGSTLALFCSACWHDATRARARGTGWADTVSDEGWRIQKKESDACSRDLAAVFERPDAPAEAFTMQLSLMTGAAPASAAEKTLSEAIARYPNHWNLHEAMLIWLLPRWGGEAGEGGAYLDAVCDLLPEDLREIAYCEYVLRFIELYNAAAVDPQEAKLNSTRAAAASSAWLATGPRDPRWVECMISLTFNDPALRQAAIDYHLAHFGAISMAGLPGIVLQEFEARKHALSRQNKKDYPAPQE